MARRLQSNCSIAFRRILFIFFNEGMRICTQISLLFLMALLLLSCSGSPIWGDYFGILGSEDEQEIQSIESLLGLLPGDSAAREISVTASGGSGAIADPDSIMASSIHGGGYTCGSTPARIVCAEQ